MAKTFEDEFMELQADMVSICLEYVEDDAEKIYIYGSCEGSITKGNCFFKIDGRVLRKHQLNQVTGKHYDVSPERQEGCLNIILEDLGKLKDVCKRYQQPMPTEIKLVYDVATRNLDAQYQYEKVYTDNIYLAPDDMERQWFEQVKAQEEGGA